MINYFDIENGGEEDLDQDDFVDPSLPPQGGTSHSDHGDVPHYDHLDVPHSDHSDSPYTPPNPPPHTDTPPPPYVDNTPPPPPAHSDIVIVQPPVAHTDTVPVTPPPPPAAGVANLNVTFDPPLGSAPDPFNTSYRSGDSGVRRNAYTVHNHESTPINIVFSNVPSGITISPSPLQVAANNSKVFTVTLSNSYLQSLSIGRSTKTIGMKITTTPGAVTVHTDTPLVPHGDHSDGVTNYVDHTDHSDTFPIHHTDSTAPPHTDAGSATGPAPTITGISPSTGDPTGGTPVTITGNNFRGGLTITVGGAKTKINYYGSSTVAFWTTAHPVGVVDVVVTNADGTSDTLVGGFTYAVSTPATPPVSISTPSLFPNASAGFVYSYQLSATGGNGTYMWSLFNNTSLPAGLSLNPTTGYVTGTPTSTATTPITTTFDVLASSAGLTSAKTFTITVDPPKTQHTDVPYIDVPPPHSDSGHVDTGGPRIFPGQT